MATGTFLVYIDSATTIYKPTTVSGVGVVGCCG